MDKKQRFGAALASLVEYAAQNGNTLTKKEISDAFADIVEDKSAYETIYDYLLSKKITVEGHRQPDDRINEFAPTDEPDFSNIEISREAAAFIEMYKRDIEAVAPLEADEKDELIRKLLSGDDRAGTRLVETHLSFALKIASGYADREVPLGDLIQEANIGLMEAVSSYDGTADFDKYIGKIIRKYITAALDEQINSDRIGGHIAERANRLEEVSKSMSKELGREPTATELSEQMNISVDEVERILKFSLNALTVDGAN